MILRLEREELPDKTKGQLFVDGNANWFNGNPGYILEDPVRDKNGDGDLDDSGEEKIYGKTAINYGRYRVITSFSNRFQKKMIQLINVRGSAIKFGDKPIDACGVRIHGGNKVADTLGCPLLGAKRQPNGDVYECKEINEKLLMLVDAADNTGEVYIDIVKKQTT